MAHKCITLQPAFSSAVIGISCYSPRNSSVFLENEAGREKLWAKNRTWWFRRSRGECFWEESDGWDDNALEMENALLNKIYAARLTRFSRPAPRLNACRTPSAGISFNKADSAKTCFAIRVWRNLADPNTVLSHRLLCHSRNIAIPLSPLDVFFYIIDSLDSTSTLEGIRNLER
ncbi:hypothetical protein EDD85DRAFT_548802 [Armillaria nabsnona]|nr:hypothetical protein EDD85DRAFT_548802 [Armillaria nabsnona]